jgi:hypothetical protein
MLRSCTRHTSANGELEPFDVGVTDEGKDLSELVVWFTITSRNGAVGILKSHRMMFRITLSHHGCYMSTRSGQGQRLKRKRHVYDNACLKQWMI